MNFSQQAKKLFHMKSEYWNSYLEFIFRIYIWDSYLEFLLEFLLKTMSGFLLKIKYKFILPFIWNIIKYVEERITET